MTKTSALVPYTPETWTTEQLMAHRAIDLDAAFHAASCLSGGWYRRPVTIGINIVGDDEFYAIAPADCDLPDGYRPAYKVERIRNEHEQ